MYSRYELRIAHYMSWTARILASVVALGVLAVAVRNFLRSPMETADCWMLVWGLSAAAAFLCVWKFEIVGALLTTVATVWLASENQLIEGAREYLLLLLLLPAMIAVGAWLRRMEYVVVTRNQDKRFKESQEQLNTT